MSLSPILSLAPTLYNLFWQSLGAPLTPTEIEAAMIIIDSDNDERISLPEFQAWWAQRSELPNLPGII